MATAYLLVSPDGKVLDANPAARSQFGDCVGKQCHQVVGLGSASGGCTEDCVGHLTASAHSQRNQRGQTSGGQGVELQCSKLMGDHVVVAVQTVGGPARKKLTAREREIMQLVAAGLTYRAIAHRLGVSWSTVRTHLEHVREKLGARNKAEAVALAWGTGEIDLGEAADSP